MGIFLDTGSNISYNKKNKTRLKAGLSGLKGRRTAGYAGTSAKSYFQRAAAGFTAGCTAGFRPAGAPARASRTTSANATSACTARSRAAAPSPTGSPGGTAAAAAASGAVYLHPYGAACPAEKWPSHAAAICLPCSAAGLFLPAAPADAPSASHDGAAPTSADHL